MFKLEKWVRPNILALKPYSSARAEFKGHEGIFLDANENPYHTSFSFHDKVRDGLNRYPDPYQIETKEKLAEVKNIPVENIFIGNGSDEAIDILIRIFCHPGKDKIILCPPTYGMYEVSAHINAVEIVNIPLNNEFQLDIDKISSHEVEKSDAKMIFLCSPNNPTGNQLIDIEQVLKTFKGIVVVDEAYIEFSTAPSMTEKLTAFPNIVVLQTFSKAWGLAGIRVGVAFASKEIIALMNKVKPPYNVSKLNQQAAVEALTRANEFQMQKEQIVAQGEWLKNKLSQLHSVKKIYPSDANFLLIEIINAERVYRQLVEAKVITCNRNSLVKNCLRVTVGTEEENKVFIEEFKKITS